MTGEILTERGRWRDSHAFHLLCDHPYLNSHVRCAWMGDVMTVFSLPFVSSVIYADIYEKVNVIAHLLSV